MTLDLQAFWREMTSAPGVVAHEDYSFNATFYLANYTDAESSRLSPLIHYNTLGRLKKRHPNLYHLLKSSRPNFDARVRRMVTDRRLLDAIGAGQTGTIELAFELMAIGQGVDARVSDFSEKYYQALYPDIAEAKVNPFRHYMEFGMREGRKTLSELRGNFHHGEQVYNPTKPTCLIGVHELSRTGAPIVGLQLAREAKEEYNVVVIGLGGGEMVEAFRGECYRLLVTDSPQDEIGYLSEDIDMNFEFAVLNSVESYRFLPFLIALRVPAAMYLHEYTEYTVSYRPLLSTMFSDMLVFSSDQVRDSWSNVMKNINFDRDRDTIIVPQDHLEERPIRRKRYQEARATLSEIIGVDCSNKRIVYGAGHAQWRKGSDMFALTAQLARRSSDDTLFIWIGDGENHEDVHFGVYYEKHLIEAGANLPGSNLITLPAGPTYPDLCAAADALYLTSRFDPLPNVVFDAVKNGCHVVCFENASGFDDARYDEVGVLHRVGFGDLQGAIDTLSRVPLKASKTPGAIKKSLTALQNAKPAPKPFEQISEALKARRLDQREFVIGHGSYDVSYLYPSGEAFAEQRQLERNFVWTRGRRQSWKNRDHIEAEIAASDNWVHDALRVETFALRLDKPTPPPFAIHVHAFYTDDLAADIANYAAYHAASKIVVTTDSGIKRRKIRDIFREANISVEVELMPNQGRDILPFLRVVESRDLGPEMIWAHVHQKKSVGTSITGDVWRTFLQTILLGDAKSMSVAIDHIARDGVGLVAALDPFDVSWSGNRRLLDRFADRFDQPLPNQPLLFPTGNMFWTKGKVATQMLELFGANYPWPNEPLANDGTVYHLIERLWPAVCAAQGKQAIFVEKADQERG
jgi:glycosyltransferase involved in cell wall biosynthesis